MDFKRVKNKDNPPAATLLLSLLETTANQVICFHASRFVSVFVRLKTVTKTNKSLKVDLDQLYLIGSL